MAVFICSAQQPLHRVVGQDELSGIDIYSMVQDSTANIWLSTSNGLYRYDGYGFHRYINNQMKTLDLFSLKTDNYGSVYCSNLYGQIFKVTNDTLILHHQISGQRLSSILPFEFDNQNNLVYCTNGYYKLNKDGNSEKILSYDGYAPNISKNALDELIFIDPEIFRLQYYKDNRLYTKQEALLPSTLAGFEIKVVSAVTQCDSIILNPMRSSKIWVKNGKKYDFINLQKKDFRSEGYRLYLRKNGTIWLADENTGIYAFQKNGKLKYSSTALFPKYSISGLMEDREGNLWLSTLGKGVIIVPNENLIDYTNHPLLRNDDIQTITSDGIGNVYLAGLNGEIYKVSNNEVNLLRKETLKLDHISYIKTTKQLLYHPYLLSIETGKVQSPKHQVGSIKDVFEIENQAILMATNAGIEYFPLPGISPWMNVKLKEVSTLSRHDGRTWCVGYNDRDSSFWYQSTSGLSMYKDSISILIRNKGRLLMANDIAIYKNSVWVASNTGLLEFKNNSLYREHHFEIENLNKIVKIKHQGQFLYLATMGGLARYNPETSDYKIIDKTKGIISNNILDFEVVNNEVWLVFAQGVQKVSFDKIQKQKVAPILEFTSILNGENDLLNKPNSYVSYDQNKWKFRFIGKSYKNQEAIVYQYLLEGFDNSWQSADYTSNQVEYKALQPGSYIFKVKSLSENFESKTIEYPFTIDKPFWLKWWFILICALLVAAIVYSIVQNRLNNVKRQLYLEQQLKLSEITAIKAQMNPHFIFNCLNSIQALVLRKESDSAYDYISKFALLVRSILHQSGTSYINIEEEIKTIELYLELEELRFSGNFQFKLITNDISDIEIPPLLIQPFIENALKHGLLHKEGLRKLNIVFDQDEDVLHCSIEDNGVGRKKATEIRKRQNINHKSFATHGTNARFELLQKQFGEQNLGVKFLDIYDDNGDAAGTKVLLNIPYRSLY